MKTFGPVSLVTLPLLPILFMVCMVMTSQSALAQTPPGGTDGDSLGADTRNLLALQVSGRDASPGPVQPIPGDEATVAYKRYLDSFSHAVPEFFEERVKLNSGS